MKLHAPSHIQRRIGEKLFLKAERDATPKSAMVRRPYPPGVHGRRRRRGLSEFGIELAETLRPATAGRQLVVDAAGLGDANMVKAGPTGAGTAQTAGDIIGDTNDIQSRLPAALVGGRIDASVGAMAADVLTDAATAADFEAKIADVVWDEDATGHQTQGTFGQAIGDPVADTGTIYKAVVTDATGVTVGTDTATLLTRMGTPSDLGGGATLAGNLSDIEAQTDDIGAAGAGLTSIPDSAGTTTLLSRIPAALFAGLTSLAQWLGLIAGKQLGNATARTEVRATGAGTGTFDEATDSLEAVRDTAPLGTAMRGTDSAATASALATAQTDLDTLTGADGATLATAQANYAPSKAGDAMALTSGERTTLAAAIWNALTSGMTTVGSLGKKLADWVVGTIDTYTGNTKQTGDVGAAGAGLTAVPWNAAWDAEVQSEVADALDAAVPASPTANSLNERVKTMDDADLPANVPAAPPKNAEYTYVVKMVDATDLSTPETGLTVSMTRSLDGAAFGAATGTVTEISTGHYKVVASAADMNGNVVTHRFTATGAADLSVVYKTVS